MVGRRIFGFFLNIERRGGKRIYSEFFTKVKKLVSVMVLKEKLHLMCLSCLVAKTDDIVGCSFSMLGDGGLGLCNLFFHSISSLCMCKHLLELVIKKIKNIYAYFAFFDHATVLFLL